MAPAALLGSTVGAPCGRASRVRRPAIGGPSAFSAGGLQRVQRAGTQNTSSRLFKAASSSTATSRRRRGPVVVEAFTGGGYEISPDLSRTEVAFKVNLDRVAPGAFLTVSVRHPGPGDHLGSGDIAVVHAHMPGDLYLQWGLGTEIDGGLSANPWEAPPDVVCPEGSVRISTWAGGPHAVRTPFRRVDSTLEIPIPTVAHKGLAFIIFDADRQCYYDNEGQAFFLDPVIAAVAAGKAQAASAEAAKAQADKLRYMAEQEALQHAASQAAQSAAMKQLQAVIAEPEPEPEPVHSHGHGAGVTEDMTPYERYLYDQKNPFKDYVSPLARAADAGFLTPPAQSQRQPPREASFEPHVEARSPPSFATAVAEPMESESASWGAVSGGSYDAPSFDEPTPPDDFGGGSDSSGGDGSLVASHTISLSTENGSSTGTLQVNIYATWPPSVELSANAGGAASGHPLLLHWGVSDHRGGTWHSPYDELASVPAGSRAPDAQSCESALHDGRGIVEFAPNNSGISCMTMLIRTENCQEWLRDSDGGDIFIDVSPALAAVQGGGASHGDAGRSSHKNGGGGGGGGDFQPTLQYNANKNHSHDNHRHDNNREAPSPPPPPPPPPPAEEQGDHMALLSNWRGSKVELKNHKGGSGDRNLQWNTDGLPDSARNIVEGDRDSASWRQKLQAMERVLCFDDPGYADIDALGYASIYLFWVGVGAIACVEDGSHYRPNHHAGSSQRIYESIENVEKHAMGQGGRRAEEVRALCRRLHPRLPAFTAEFTQSVPLTRIRDIAHGKGDEHGKCREVRQEIKHTIQNKLHRCAGPEDLVATEAMLAKLTAPGTDYPEAFVEEFRIFHKELKDFFNASTVTDRLERLLNEGDVPGEVADHCRRFMQAKATVDGIAGGTEADPVLLAALEEALWALCAARRTIDWEVSNGGLSSAPADQRQQWRLAEIGLEDYAFVLLSRGINALGAESDPPRAELTGTEMRAALQFLAASAEATSLSAGGGGGEEFGHIAHEAGELATAGAGGMPPGGEEGALRVRAVAERARRAAEDYCALLSDLFDGRAEALGRSLGIDRGTVDVFTEGQIRASVVFQSAKLASHLLRAARAATGEAGWDCLVPGEVIGARLLSVPRLDPADPTIASLTAENPAVLLVSSADGDEEVSTCGPGVAGILLCHALPHLSHLALRARQAGVPLVAIEDPGLVNHARSLENAPGVRLNAQPSNITLDASEGGYVASGAGGGSSTSAVSAAALVADTSRAGRVLQLAELGSLQWDEGVALAGSKASACARLSALAADPNAAFQAPPGAVLPFGSMEEAAAAAGAEQRFQFLMDALESVSGNAAETAGVCAELQDLVRQLRPSNDVLSGLAATFGHTYGAKVMVRSSGNAEDLAGLSAAGLYDSISNVDPSRPEVLGAAVAEVWASLYTPRAVASRAAAGVGQRGASMAVLVQQMLVPEVSFILMTRHPMSDDPDVAYAELALGHGETLASGAVRGTPWRMSMNKAQGTVQMHTFSSFGTALVPDLDGDGSLKSEAVNCAGHWLTTDEGARCELAGRLVHAGMHIEHVLGAMHDTAAPLPQDIEGCLTPDGSLWVVQARPQP